jgi:hypothetical protein
MSPSIDSRENPEFAAEIKFFIDPAIAAQLRDWTASVAGNNLTIAWAPTGGRLQSTAAFVGAATVWKDVGTANPATVPITGSSLFLRVVSP